MALQNSFNLNGRVALITGGAGLLGVKHAEAIAEMGGIPILLDQDGERAIEQAERIASVFDKPVAGFHLDITDEAAVAERVSHVVQKFGRIDILINNAANNPKVEGDTLKDEGLTRLERLPVEVWNKDIAVGLTGAFFCSRHAGAHMAKKGSGVILNVASDLALIAPDQRIYRKDDLSDGQQPVKPVTYSVVKSGLVGLTKYLATYWADRGVRANAIAPGGVLDGQAEQFQAQLNRLIPMGRMANPDEYKAAVVFLVSDASSYMTGAVVSIDGGRTCW